MCGFPTVEVVEQYSDYCCIYWLVVSSTLFYREKIVRLGYVCELCCSLGPIYFLLDG